MTDNSTNTMGFQQKLAHEAEKDKIKQLVPTVRITKVYYRSRQDGFVPVWIRQRGVDRETIKHANNKESKDDHIDIAQVEEYKWELKFKDFSCQFLDTKKAFNDVSTQTVQGLI